MSQAASPASDPVRGSPLRAESTGRREGPLSPARLYARWIPVCAAAEFLGIAAGALWWVAMDRLSPNPVLFGEKLLMLALKALAGVPEGLVLAILQASMLRRRYPGLPIRPWVLLTIAVAVLGWAAGSAVPLFGSFEQGESVEPPLALVILFASGFGVAVGGIFGAAQAIALRRAAEHASWWILANAAAWGLALPVVYAAAGIFDGVPSVAAILVAGLAGGLAAGLLLGAVTGLAFWLMEPLARSVRAGLR